MPWASFLPFSHANNRYVHCSPLYGVYVPRVGGLWPRSSFIVFLTFRHITFIHFWLGPWSGRRLPQNIWNARILITPRGIGKIKSYTAMGVCWRNWFETFTVAGTIITNENKGCLLVITAIIDTAITKQSCIDSIVSVRVSVKVKNVKILEQRTYSHVNGIRAGTLVFIFPISREAFVNMDWHTASPFGYIATIMSSKSCR